MADEDWDTTDSESGDPITPSCAVCRKEGTKDKPMKHCSKCKITKYCSRECQSAHWKYHKVVCNAEKDLKEGKAFDPSASTVSQGLSAPFTKPFDALHEKKYLHNRPEKDVYKILIDCYRLRLEDDYKFTGDVDEDSIYGGAPDGCAGFRRFLNRARKRKSVLPDWWSSEKTKDCMRLGQDGGWSNLNYSIDKGDVIEHYENPLMPMQLRMLGEQILGVASWGQGS